MAESIYLEQVRAVLPRLLAMYDTDRSSSTYGQGDRFRWAWKLIDFGNGTFQGAAHGLAWLYAHDLLPPELPATAALKRIEGMREGAAALTRRNGSLEEAFPHESSFCVTALVAYDLLAALEVLGSSLDAGGRESWLRTIEPMIGFLGKADETHGFISNHLATAAAALCRWTAETGDPGAERGNMFLERILRRQSAEGWFREYEGADPGYQTLCTYYLADLHRLRPDLGLLEPLRRSVRYLWNFAHPDGSFGGLYGSRNTRLYYPAGIELLAADIPEAASLATFMRKSIAGLRTVTLTAMDAANLPPMFNAYCRGAVAVAGRPAELANYPAIPAVQEDTWRRDFPDAGLLVDKGPDHYTIISYHKGGVCYHFNPEMWVDAGVVVEGPRGHRFSTQAYQLQNHVEVGDTSVTVTAALTPLNKRIPTPLQFLMLRILNLSVMRISAASALVKRALVHLLITGSKPSPIVNRRTILLGPNLEIRDDLLESDRYRRLLPAGAAFSAIHMASQGYWQKQDEFVP